MFFQTETVITSNERKDKNLVLDPHEKHMGMTIGDEDCGRKKAEPPC